MGTHPQFSDSGPSVAYLPETTDTSDGSQAGTVVPSLNLKNYNASRATGTQNGAVVGGGATISLNVGLTATAAPVAIPACLGNSIRVHNLVGSQSPVAYLITTSNTTSAPNVPVFPIAFSTSGTASGGSVPGDMVIDPGQVEIIGLSSAGIAALNAGTLYVAAICAVGSATIHVTPGFGS